MTKELFNAVSRAFKTDYPPIHAVAIDDNERVYVVADMFESYRPAMPEGMRNHGFLGTGIFELRDTGKGYCDMPDIKFFRHALRAHIEFSHFAKGMKTAENERTLKELLKNVHVDDEAAALTA